MLDYRKESMEELASQLRLGCTETRNKMIEGYMPLVHGKVNKWLQIYPGLKYMSDDMVSEGYLAVVEAIDAIAKSDKPVSSNVTAYVSVAVVNAIGDFLDSNDIIRVPRSSDDPAPAIEPLSFENHAPGSGHACQHAHMEFWELIDKSCFTDEERAIVDLLSRGYNEREIAQQLDMSRSTVNMLRMEIHERFTQLECD